MLWAASGGKACRGAADEISWRQSAWEEGGIQCVPFFFTPSRSKASSHAAASLGLFLLLRGSDVCAPLPAQSPEWTWKIYEVGGIPSFSQPFWNACCRIPFLFSTHAASGKGTVTRNQESPQYKRKTGSWWSLLLPWELSSCPWNQQGWAGVAYLRRLLPLSHSIIILLLLGYYSNAQTLVFYTIVFDKFQSTITCIILFNLGQHSPTWPLYLFFLSPLKLFQPHISCSLVRKSKHSQWTPAGCSKDHAVGWGGTKTAPCHHPNLPVTLC